MACRCFHQIGGHSDLVIDGETGLLAEPNDSLDLTHKLQRLIEDRPVAQRGCRNRAELLSSII